MRGFLIVVVLVGLGFLYYKQKQSGQAPAAATAQTTINQPAQAVRTTAAQPATATQPAQPSGPNWMKRSLDRARDVRDEARTQTQESQNP